MGAGLYCGGFIALVRHQQLTQDQDVPVAGRQPADGAVGVDDGLGMHHTRYRFHHLVHLTQEKVLVEFTVLQTEGLLQGGVDGCGNFFGIVGCAINRDQHLQGKGSMPVSRYQNLQARNGVSQDKIGQAPGQGAQFAATGRHYHYLDLLVTAQTRRPGKGFGLPDTALAHDQRVEILQGHRPFQGQQGGRRIFLQGHQALHVVAAGGPQGLADLVHQVVRPGRFGKTAGVKVAAKAGTFTVSETYVVAAGGQAAAVPAVTEGDFQMAVLGHAHRVVGIGRTAVLEAGHLFPDTVGDLDLYSRFYPGGLGGIGDEGDVCITKHKGLAQPGCIAAAQNLFPLGLPMAGRHHIGGNEGIAVGLPGGQVLA